ncbi:MAG: hypothetical protein CSB55_03135 [Candidatus Cloacimonadota bacterium]|nr:MAG: hypothetical protein CSB55_03135 [Candidatus Cloacimonadota bacterium]
MRKLLLVFLMIIITSQISGIELSEPDPDDTKRITAVIQLTSEFRFSSNLNEGDEVIYEINEDNPTEEYSEHILKVIDKNDSTTTVLELFEGNKLFTEFTNSNKRVVRIWGKDIAGGDHNLTLLSDNELREIIKSKNNLPGIFSKINKWQIINSRDKYELNGSSISYIKIELDLDNMDISKKTKEILRANKAENTLLLSNDIPKMFPLVPVAFTNMSKKDILTKNDAGFVKNNNLRLKSFKRGK